MKNAIIYLVMHSFDVDGGFGDPVYEEEVLFTTADKDLAYAYCRKWDDEFTFEEHSWGDFVKNRLFVREMPLDTNFDLNTPPPVNSHYEIRKEKFPVAYSKRQKELELRRRAAEIEWKKKQREREVDELKAACEAVGCTFTPAD